MEEIKNTTAPADSEQVQVRRQKLADLRAAGSDPFTITKFPQDAYSANLKAEYTNLPNEADAGRTAALAGRMMSKRVMGKASFAHLRDDKGDIQLYVRRDELGEEAYAAFKKLDVGDIIGVRGEVFRTKTGELSLRVTELTLLAKSLRPLPEKFHGLTDTEMRYRQRYVDLIANPEVKDTFVKRSRILKEIRAYLDEKGFLEVDTPILTPFEIGASARPFITHHNTLNMDMVLRIETELYLKRLVVGGMDRVYEVGRIFRNEGMDPNAAVVVVVMAVVLVVFVVMMGAHRVVVKGKSAAEKGKDGFVCLSRDAAVNLDARLGKRHLCAHADAAADELFDAPLLEEPRKRAVAAAVRGNDFAFRHLAVFHVVDLKGLRVAEVREYVPVFISHCNFHCFTSFQSFLYDTTRRKNKQQKGTACTVPLWKMSIVRAENNDQNRGD